MIFSTPTVFSGTARVTITGYFVAMVLLPTQAANPRPFAPPYNPTFPLQACLAATFFKQTVFDTTHQELYNAGDRLSVGAAVANS
ncbi:hypothetical protein F4604DRAFT_1747389, partial [Suillus subluteus]